MKLARELAFTAVDGSLGVIESHALTVESAGPGAVQWLLVPELPTGFAPRLMTSHAYQALRAGELTSAGLLHDGRLWQLSDRWDGRRLFADLIPA